MIKVVCSTCGGDMTAEFLKVLGLAFSEDGFLDHNLDVDLDKLCDLAIAGYENGDGDRDGDGDEGKNIITSDGIDLEGIRQWYAWPIPNAVTVKETLYLCRVGLIIILLIMVDSYFLCPMCRPALSKGLQ